MIQECSRQIRLTALIASSLLESQNRASYSGATLPKTQLGDWCFAGSPYLWVSVPALSLTSQLTSVLEAGLLGKVEKRLEWGHGAERTWFP